MWTVPEGGDIGSSQAGGCGFGEKRSDSGSILKVELSGVPYKLDMTLDLGKKVFLFLFLFSVCFPHPYPQQVQNGASWGGAGGVGDMLSGHHGSAVRVKAWRHHFGAHWLEAGRAQKSECRQRGQTPKEWARCHQCGESSGAIFKVSSEIQVEWPQLGNPPLNQ